MHIVTLYYTRFQNKIKEIRLVGEIFFGELSNIVSVNLRTHSIAVCAVVISGVCEQSQALFLSPADKPSLKPPSRPVGAFLPRGCVNVPPSVTAAKTAAKPALCAVLSRQGEAANGGDGGSPSAHLANGKV